MPVIPFAPNTNQALSPAPSGSAPSQAHLAMALATMIDQAKQAKAQKDAKP